MVGPSHAPLALARTLAALLVASSLSACVTRPPGTDLFGRPIARTEAESPPPVATEPLQPPVAVEPAARPAWSPAAIITDARMVDEHVYVVVAGDTLRGIGNRTGAGSEAIAAANALSEPYVIRPGQRLRIPGGRYHEVRAGQTGIAIARAYGVDWSSIVADNALSAPYVLRIGQRLRLPAGTTDTRMMTIEERARAFTLDIDDIVTGGTPATSATPTAQPPAVTAPARFQWPIEGRVIARFGPAASGRRNDGIGIAAPVGTPVRATADGEVIYAGNDIGVLGGLLLIDHGGGWISAYGHMGTLAVGQGARVAAGSVIGTSGESGQADQPQLQFQLRHNRRPVDPLTRLAGR